MTTIPFDTLAYARKLEEAGFTRQQAEVQAEAMRQQAETLRQQAEAQNAAIQKTLEKYDETSRRELSTKADLKELELRLLKWQFGIGLALAAIMAKGFGWIGF